MHLTSNPVDWYTARAAGLTAYLLLTGVVLLGLTMAGKKTFARWPRFSIEEIHRFAGLLVGAFITIHVLTIAIDAWLPFSIGSIIVPFTTRYRPVWVGLGVVAAELLLALAVTNHYRRRLPYRTWRTAHYLNFAVWTAATFHGVGSGTDRSSPWLLAVVLTCTACVTAAIVWRSAGKQVGRLVRPIAVAVSVAACALIAWLALGPVRFKPAPWNAPSFEESLTGHLAQLNGLTRGIVSMAGEGTGRQHVLIRADLLLTPRRLLKTSFQMEYLPSGELCTGKVTGVQPAGFGATCRLKTGARRFIEARWQPTIGNQVAGSITARA